MFRTPPWPECAAPEKMAEVSGLQVLRRSLLAVALNWDQGRGEREHGLKVGLGETVEQVLCRWRPRAGDLDRDLPQAPLSAKAQTAALHLAEEGVLVEAGLVVPLHETCQEKAESALGQPAAQSREVGPWPPRKESAQLAPSWLPPPQAKVGRSTCQGCLSFMVFLPGAVCGLP